MTYLVLGESIVALLDEVLHRLHPLGELGPGHLEKRPGTAQVAVGVAIGLLEFALVLLKVVQGAVDIGVDSHDETGVNLDLLQLFAKGLVSILGHALREGCQSIREHLAALVPLGLRLGGERRAVGTAIGSERAIDHGEVVGSHGEGLVKRW